MARVATECEVEFPVGTERCGVDGFVGFGGEWDWKKRFWFLSATHKIVGDISCYVGLVISSDRLLCTYWQLGPL